MVELHKFLYMSNDSDLNILKERVLNHLQYMPHKKLYRYRKSTNREITTLSKNSIWLSNPESFVDVFDATIPIQDDVTIASDYGFRFTAEVAYKAIVETAKDDEFVPSKEAFYQAMCEAKTTYNTRYKIDKKMREIYGNEYEMYETRKLALSEHNRVVEKKARAAIEFMHYVAEQPRKTMSIASFSRSKDNRNMWENYASNYSGFCVEYDFYRAIESFDAKTAWDILHLLPVSYYAKREPLNHSKILQSLVTHHTKQGEFDIDVEEILKSEYLSLTTKLLDYRSEKEWRLVMPNKHYGLYEFPYVSAIYLGKDMPDNKAGKLLSI